MNQSIQDNDILTKSFFLEIMQGVNSNFDSVNKRFDSVNKRFDSVNKKFDRVNKKLNENDKNFQRIYDVIDDLSIKLEKYIERNEEEHKITRRDMNGHFDHIYKKLEDYDYEWSCLNAWISRQEKENKFKFS